MTEGNMAQSAEQTIAGGDFQIGAIQDAKSRIAPITRDGKPVLITLSAKPTLTTPFSPWPPSNEESDRCSIDIRITPELAKLAEWIDECIQRQVQASPSTWYSKVPKEPRVPLQLLPARGERGGMQRHAPDQV